MTTLAWHFYDNIERFWWFRRPAENDWKQPETTRNNHKSNFIISLLHSYNIFMIFITISNINIVYISWFSKVLFKLRSSPYHYKQQKGFIHYKASWFENHLRTLIACPLYKTKSMKLILHYVYRRFNNQLYMITSRGSRIQSNSKPFLLRTVFSEVESLRFIRDVSHCAPVKLRGML